MPFRSCRSGPTYVKNFFAQAVRRQASGLPFRSCRCGPHFRDRMCPKFTAVSIFGMRFHGLRLSFFSEKRMESRQRKKTPPHHCGLKNWLVTTLRATRSLRSLKQALRLTPPANFSPFGHRPPFKGAGSCTSACLCRAFLRMHIPYEDVLSHGGAGPHSKAFPSLMPGEVSRRVQERSLMIA